MRPRHQYTVLRPDANGNPIGGGYKCGACGLEGLTYGEPHYSAVGLVCEPHPEGKEITTFAPAGPGMAGAPAVRSAAGAPIGGANVNPALAADIAKLKPEDQTQLHEMVRTRLESYSHPANPRAREVKIGDRTVTLTDPAPAAEPGEVVVDPPAPVPIST